MQDNQDKQTLDLLGAKRRGRPSTGKALTSAERVRKHRQKKTDVIDDYFAGNPTRAELEQRLEHLLSLLRKECAPSTLDAYLVRLVAVRERLGLVWKRPQR